MDNMMMIIRLPDDDDDGGDDDDDADAADDDDDDADDDDADDDDYYYFLIIIIIIIFIIIILLPKGYIWARSKSFLEWLLILPSSKDTKDYLKIHCFSLEIYKWHDFSVAMLAYWRISELDMVHWDSRK
jgi:hypothetical protein